MMSPAASNVCPCATAPPVAVEQVLRLQVLLVLSFSSLFEDDKGAKQV